MEKESSYHHMESFVSPVSYCYLLFHLQRARFSPPTSALSPRTQAQTQPPPLDPSRSFSRKKPKTRKKTKPPPSPAAAPFVPSARVRPRLHPIPAFAAGARDPAPRFTGFLHRRRPRPSSPICRSMSFTSTTHLWPLAQRRRRP